MGNGDQRGLGMHTGQGRMRRTRVVSQHIQNYGGRAFLPTAADDIKGDSKLKLCDLGHKPCVTKQY